MLKKIITFTIILISCNTAFSQTIGYEYDNSGNRVRRYVPPPFAQTNANPETGQEKKLVTKKTLEPIIFPNMVVVGNKPKYTGVKE